uniref:BAG domain-containing protein n=1 Tax=Eptatretus burgeri TaxID=7764 RepID=A0A8C4N458_EPTBU
RRVSSHQDLVQTSGPLPPGWEMSRDPTTGWAFFIDHNTPQLPPTSKYVHGSTCYPFEPSSTAYSSSTLPRQYGSASFQPSALPLSTCSHCPPDTVGCRPFPQAVAQCNSTCPCPDSTRSCFASYANQNGTDSACCSAPALYAKPHAAQPMYTQPSNAQSPYPQTSSHLAYSQPSNAQMPYVQSSTAQPAYHSSASQQPYHHPPAAQMAYAQSTTSRTPYPQVPSTQQIYHPPTAVQPSYPESPDSQIPYYQTSTQPTYYDHADLQSGCSSHAVAQDAAGTVRRPQQPFETSTIPRANGQSRISAPSEIQYTSNPCCGPSPDLHCPHHPAAPEQQSGVDKSRTVMGPGSHNDNLAMMEIAAVLVEVEHLGSEVLQFRGMRSSREFAHLEELLTKQMLRLDSIETGGQADIRQRRRTVVCQVQSLLNFLESNARNDIAHQLGFYRTISRSVHEHQQTNDVKDRPRSA